MPPINQNKPNRPADSEQRYRFDLFYQVRNLLRQKLPIGQPPTVSQRPGMGAIPYRGGTTFRVWAPNAQAVSVAGSFNKWSFESHPLVSEANGYWSVDIPRVSAGDEFKFVLRNDGRRLLRTDPYAQRVNGNYLNGVVVQPPDDAPEEPFVPPAICDLVIYEMHVGTFHDRSDRPPGTFQGVIEKLPYLQQLGFNAIELMPVGEFAGDLSWGYNPSHPFAVARVYGGLDEFRRLVDAAHRAGIAIIVDVVYNHFGPQDLSLWQFDGWSANGKGGVYFYNDWRAKTPWGDTRPDYGRPEVRRYIRDNAMMWLERLNVDGLRWDGTAYIRNVHGHDGDPAAEIAEGWLLMQEISNEVRAKFPHKLLIAEDLQGNAAITRPTDQGGAGFNAQWDSRFVHPVRQSVISAYDDDRGLYGVRDALMFRYNDDPFQRVVYTESHDEVSNGKARVPEEIAPGEANTVFAKKRAVLGAALVFTAPGVPMIFQGQEFLEEGWFADDVKLDWSKALDNEGVVVLFRDLIRLRRNMRGMTGGLCGPHINVFRCDNQNKLLAYHRWNNGGACDDVVVVANFANKTVEAAEIGFPRPGTWRVRFNSDLQVYDEAFGDMFNGDVTAVAGEYDGLQAHGTIGIAPYAVVIFSQDELQAEPEEPNAESNGDELAEGDPAAVDDHSAESDEADSEQPA